MRCDHLVVVRPFKLRRLRHYREGHVSTGKLCYELTSKHSVWKSGHGVAVLEEVDGIVSVVSEVNGTPFVGRAHRSFFRGATAAPWELDDAVIDRLKELANSVVVASENQ